MRELSVTEQRYQAVLAVIEDGVPVTEVAAKIGVSRQTVQAWLSRYADAGLDGLVDRSHRPYGCPHRMPAAVGVRLTELRQLHPGWGADRLLYRLAREGVDPLPSRAAVVRRADAHNSTHILDQVRSRNCRCTPEGVADDEPDATSTTARRQATGSVSGSDCTPANRSKSTATCSATR